MIDRKKIFAGILITVFSGLLAGCTVYLPDKETAPDPAAGRQQSRMSQRRTARSRI